MRLYIYDASGNAIIFRKQDITLTELQIRGSYEDNSKIIFLIFQRKHML